MTPGSSTSPTASPAWTTVASSRLKTSAARPPPDRRLRTTDEGQTTMIRKYVLPVIAPLGLLMAVFLVLQGSKAVPAAQPVTQPAPAPYATYIAGAGLIEAATENIAIGTGVGG